MTPRTAGLLLRIAAAGPGGYVLAYAVSGAGALALAPLTGRAEAATATSMAGIVVMTGAILWSFCARTAVRAALGVTVPAAACFVPLALTALTAR